MPGRGVRWRPRTWALRTRLALAAVAASALVLPATALLASRRIEAALAAAVHEQLVRRADEVTSDLQDGSLSAGNEDPLTEVLAADGEVLATSRLASGDAESGVPPLLDPLTVRAVLAEGRSRELDREVPGFATHARLLVRPVTTRRGEQAVVLVGESRDAIDRGLDNTNRLLLVSTPILLVLVATGGWLVAGAALRPVRWMSDEAGAISLAEPGRRLPMPDGNDELAVLGRTLNEMLARLEAAVAREASLVADASHELRTPLAVLRAELELALLEGDDPPALRAAIESALEEVGRLSRLTSDLLVLAQADAGALPHRAQLVDLAEVAEAVARRQDGVAGAEVVVEHDGGPLLVRADPDRLDQVLTNLVANAARAARTRVAVQLGVDVDHPTVTVADDGAGFPPELLPRVFERFSRGADVRAGGGGAGLGLAIAAALVHRAGGTITAGNHGPLGGAAVVVRLPPA